MLDRSTEIRKLPPSHIRELALILDYGDSWKSLMSIIPCTLEKENFVCDLKPTNLKKYHSDHFKIIENAGGAPPSRRTCTEILFDEWGTSGRVRPALGHLLHLLTRAGLYRAADYVAVDILKEEAPKRPRKGPAAPIDLVIPQRDGNVHNEVETSSGDISVPDDWLNQQVEIIRSQRTNNETVPMATPSPPPRIVISESPEIDIVLQSFELPVVLEREKPPSEDIPNLSSLLNLSSNSENNISPISESPDLNALLNSTENNSLNTVHTENISEMSSEISNESQTQSTQSENTSENNSKNDNSSQVLPALSVLMINERPKSVSPLPQLSLDTTLPHFDYEKLEKTTNNFDERPFESEELPGRFLGAGAFKSVFLAVNLMDIPVAVKKLNLIEGDIVTEGDLVTSQFRNEVDILSRHRHKNLLSLLGYSCDGPTYCLICEYAPGGTLESRLKESSKPPLLFDKRISIALGTSKALAYLHSEGLKHRDVKSANILLDAQDEPLLSDFGVADLIAEQSGQVAFGTQAYMAPEAYSSTDTEFLDVYAFGVVVFELLTSLPPLSNESTDIVSLVEEKCENEEIGELLDVNIGSWKKNNISFSQELSKIGFNCIKYDKDQRPRMIQVCDILERLVQML